MVLELNGYQKWKEFDKDSKIAYYETVDVWWQDILAD